MTYSWIVDVSLINDSGTCSFDSSTSATPTLTCTDDGTASVTLTVDDGKGGSDDDTEPVTVSNVAPEASNPSSLSVNHVTGVVGGSFDFADEGTNDTHTASFTWSHGTPGTSSVSETNGAGTASGSATFITGCYTVDVTGKVTDDEGAHSNVVTLAADYQTDIYSVSFLAPIKDEERNFAKYGNVLPVKVKIASSCTGASITNVNLFLSWVKGTGDAIEGDEVITASVSSADGSG